MIRTIKTVQMAALAVILTVTAAASGQFFDPNKVMADQAKMAALQEKGFAGAELKAATTGLNDYNDKLAEAETAFAANQNNMTLAQRDAYYDQHALALAWGVIADGHFETGDARMIHGNNQMTAGDAHYAAGRYPDAKVCYDGPPPAQDEGAKQHYERARMDYSDAETCYSQAWWHAQQALNATQP